MSALPEINFEVLLSETERLGAIHHLDASLCHLDVLVADIGHLKVDELLTVPVRLLVVFKPE